jgi:hypothetical protein
MLMTPSNGKSISGRNDVTGIGTASETHHVTIHAPIASTLLAPGEMKVSGTMRIISRKKKGPKKNPS